MAALAILLQDGENVLVEAHIRRQGRAPCQEPDDQISKHARILARELRRKQGLGHHIR
jgi:hypothetical protein